MQQTLLNVWLVSLLATILLSCGTENSKLKEPFRVTIQDIDYSLAYSKIYQLTEDSIKVIFSGHIMGESDSVLFTRQLSSEEKITIMNFFTDFPVQQLEDWYRDVPSKGIKDANIELPTDDGDQKFFEFQVGNIKKQVQTSNHYQDDLGRLVALFNSLLVGSDTIRYIGTN